MTATVIPVSGLLPGSGRPFRLAVSEHAAGVWVAPAEKGRRPFVAIVGHEHLYGADDARDRVSVSQYVLTGESETES